MSGTIRFLAHSTHTLKCAAVLAATKDEAQLEKVPLCVGVQGGCVLELPSGETVVGAGAICRLLLSNAKGGENTTALLGPGDATEGRFVEEWLEACDVALDGAALQWFSEIAAGVPPSPQARSDALAFLARLEQAVSAKRGAPVLSALSLADITLWAGLYPALASGGVLPADERANYPAVLAWFAFMNDLTVCKDALIRTKTRTPRTLLTPFAPVDPAGQKFYITTAINYTNGIPHMGHAYEAVTADIIARYHRVYGREVFFLTGTDEHGQKIAQTAEGMGLRPIDICDKYALAFQELNKRIDVTNDFYIRTTMDKHKVVAQQLFIQATENGDIYLDTYSGWYNVREETFVTENDAALTDYKDPSSGKPLDKMTEESYFFKMSKYQERLLAHIEANPEFIQPAVRRNEMLERLREPLRDLSVSRTTFDWGVPVPEHPTLLSGKPHVMYVWFDALSNYLSGCDYPDGPNSHFWPAGIHLIGKDIIWFHCVIWPCMLMSCNLPLPATVFSHGFINDREGKKMSKSLGNVIDPHDQLNRVCGPDSFRFYLAYSSSFGADIPYSEEGLILMHNAELADTLGNLMHRASNITQKYCGGLVPNVPAAPSFDLIRLTAETNEAMRSFQLQEAVFAALTAVKDTNKYLTILAPWHIKADPAAGISEEDADLRRQVTCRSVLEAMYILAHFLAPYIPRASAEMFKKLGTPMTTIPKLSAAFDNLTPGTAVSVGEVLFKKLEKEVVVVAEVFPCDMRVAKILEVAEHPEQDTLFIIQVDVGDAGKKQVCAGLRGKYEVAELIGKSIVILLNLKPAEFKGVKSDGMMLVGDQQKPSKLQGLLCAGDGSVAPGTKVECEGATTQVAENMDLKLFQKLELKVLDELKVFYKKTMKLSAGGQQLVAERVKPNSNVR